MGKPAKKKETHRGLESEHEYEVEALVDCESVDGLLLYRVRWAGYQQHEDTWEPLANLVNVMHLVNQFHQKHRHPTPKPTITNKIWKPRNKKWQKKTPIESTSSLQETSTLHKQVGEREDSDEDSMIISSSADFCANQFYHVQQIVDKKIGKRGRVLYRVRWLGYSEKQDTWEPLQNLSNILNLVQHFQANFQTHPTNKKATNESMVKLKDEAIQKKPKKRKRIQKIIKTDIIKSQQSEQNQEFDVEKIVSRRIKSSQLQYRVRWTGYKPKDDTWQPISNLSNVTKLINQFQAHYQIITHRRQRRQHTQQVSAPIPQQLPVEVMMETDNYDIGGTFDLDSLMDLEFDVQNYEEYGLEENQKEEGSSPLDLEQVVGSEQDEIVSIDLQMDPQLSPLYF